MKRSGSRSLDDWATVKRHAPDAGLKQPAGPRAGASSGRGYGLASSGLQRAGSGSVGADTCSGGVGVASAPPTRGLPEVCSPPPSKPLNFVGPVEVPVSPFSKVPVPCSGDAPPCPWLHGGEGDRQQQPAAGSEEEEEEWDQENQQPYGPAAEAAGTPLTWLVSPVSRGGRPPASAPLAIPAPRHRHGAASVLSPGMPTPARDTPLPSAAAVIPLHHCPSFSSWMVSASRPPSATPQPGGGVADVVGNVLADVTAARRFDGGCPSHLDLLLAQLGDTHYPASVMQWEQEELPESPTAPECGL